ncbi:MAG: carboxylating nicotinate-nucleotide diphosphorylase [Candidatus Thermoplasmatota archaeon]|jgi:nicotinate-nucleotide pyrophosphorylase (carboxylating)|nr:carboxylating nicotinate-nucleotide diphosphorylase [Candidatus Thermoplasmatota archaeon]
MRALTSQERDALIGYLEDDHGRGDPTSALFGAKDRGRAVIICEEGGILSGLEPAQFIFSVLGATLKVTEGLTTGAMLDKGASVAEVEGPVPSLLAGERTALNLLSRMSGIATMAKKASELASGSSPGARVAGTRKTTPGSHLFEKRALMDGGALPHRTDLSSLAMVKDNHIAALGGGPAAIGRAVSKLKYLYGPYLPIEVECGTVEEAIAALEAGADIIMLDNMGVDGVRKTSSALRDAMSRSHKRASIEASGGIALKDIPLIAPHVDVISMGSLTYGAHPISFKMEMELSLPHK